MKEKRTPIKKILIANRGEIACRVMKTCKKLGIGTVAVYSDADAKALHVAMADEARHIGPPSPRESYLVIEKIIAAAKDAGADAVHPGYGFLSENEGFAESCAQAGLRFIGPPPAAIRAMGGKSEAKALMEKAGVPLVPGYHGDNQDEKFLLKEAGNIGFPVLIKASAGGGGKGMRVVNAAAEFADALTGAKREAKASFGDDHVLVEKYLANPRHVEIQVFADAHGNCVYLFERDCSVQRRHQKVLEEAPAPGLSQKTREKMGAAAVKAAQAIGYEGAGTVEFLLDSKENFYFMEMNTRLQVEHPVTEMITGLDLVALQIRVAEGEKLPFAQKDLKINGHAFEARLYAEDPARDFLPGAGTLRHLSFPRPSPLPATAGEGGAHAPFAHGRERDCPAMDAAGQALSPTLSRHAPGEGAIRIDTGVRSGDAITIHYDPMIAKIIVWGESRDAALAVLAAALDATHVAGPKSNVSFLRALARHPAFKAGNISTSFIKDHHADLLPPKSPASRKTLALAAAGLLKEQGREGGDPWADLSAWRIGGGDPHVFRFKDEAGEYDIALQDADLQTPAAVIRDGAQLAVMYDGHDAELTYLDPLHAGEAQDTGAGRLTAPMPGKVVAVHVGQGANVKKGQPLVIVEAMKMEHTITAPKDGIIAAVNVGVGEQVDEKKELVRFQDAA